MKLKKRRKNEIQSRRKKIIKVWATINEIENTKLAKLTKRKFFESFDNINSVVNQWINKRENANYKYQGWRQGYYYRSSTHYKDI